jgi:hypothetical protein
VLNLFLASLASTPSFNITNPKRMLCPAARKASSAADTLAPLASIKILTARSCNFSFVSTASIIKFS